MATFKDVAQLRAAFDRITARRGDVAELRAAFDRNNAKREKEQAHGRQRTRSASPGLVSAREQKHVPGNATPEQWQSPRDVHQQIHTSGNASPEQLPTPRQQCVSPFDVPEHGQSPHQCHVFPHKDPQCCSPCAPIFWPWFVSHGQPMQFGNEVPRLYMPQVTPREGWFPSASLDNSANGVVTSKASRTANWPKTSKPDGWYSRRHQYKVENGGR